MGNLAKIRYATAWGRGTGGFKGIGERAPSVDDLLAVLPPELRSSGTPVVSVEVV